MSQSDLFSAPAGGDVADIGPNTTVAALKEAAEGCTRCDLYRNATQVVFSEGPADARLMFVGEAPGDQEDRQGRPFVGPAGQLFDRALLDAGIDRASVYLTNAVKHFKFEPRGRRRIHAKPDNSEIAACNYWLVREFAVLKPRTVVALGATAGQAITGRRVAVMKERGTMARDERGFDILFTVHPSFLLRLPDERSKAAAYEAFVADLKKVA
jgi:DNA polymerase